MIYFHFNHQLWQYGLWYFQTGDTKLERFFPKNQYTQRKLLNFEFWIKNGKNVTNLVLKARCILDGLVGNIIIFEKIVY